MTVQNVSLIICGHFGLSRVFLHESNRIIILPKIKHLFNEQTALMKHRLRSNGKGLINQKQYTDKLESLFYISHASAYKLIKNEEDREFLRLQKKSRTDCIGPVDRKLFGQEKRSAERQKRLQTRLEVTALLHLQ